MKKALILLALMMFIGMPVLAQDKPKEEPKKEAKDEPKEEAKKDSKKEAKKDSKKDAADKVDEWALYKKKGRTWTHKTVGKCMGREDVSYDKYEVLEVTETGAKVKVSTLDKDKKELFSETLDFEFKAVSRDGGKSDGGAAIKVTYETIKVEAGVFECQKATGERDRHKGTTWRSKKYPYLIVRNEGKGPDDEYLTELVEFKD